MPGKKSAVPMGEMIHVKGDIYKVRTLYRGSSFNRYFVKTRCATCGTEFFRDRPNSKKNDKGYCSAVCKKAGNSGPNNCNWKGGIKNKRGVKGGHILEYAPEHPFARKNFVAQHRLVVEKAIGRTLLPGELVHHVNCDMQDNRIENLVIMTLEQHNLAHASLERCVKDLIGSGVLIFCPDDGVYKVRGV